MIRVYWSLAAILFGALLYFMLNRPGLQGDTVFLVDNVRHGLACLKEGQLVGCIAAGGFPLHQFAPALILTALGMTPGQVIHSLAYLSFFSFIGISWMMFRELGRHGLAIQWAGLIVLLSGYLLKYANLSFGEMWGAFLILSFVVAYSRNWGWRWVVPLFLAASASKDTAWIFVSWIGVILAVTSSRLRDLPLISILGASGFSLVSVFNYFRFESILNRNYAVPEYMVTEGSRVASYWAAIWFSPSGGIFFFWPTLLVLLLLPILGGVSRSFSRLRIWIGTVVLLGGLSFGFAHWFAPLGWHSWGARLMVPWLPAALFLILDGYALEIRAVLSGWARRSNLFWISALSLAWLTLPQYLVLFSSGWVNRMIESHPPGDLNHALWPSHWIWLEMLLPFLNPAHWALAAFYSSILVFALLRLRRYSMSM